MKKLAQPTRSFFTLKISWKTSPGWLQLFFHFGTENRADQLKKPPCRMLRFITVFYWAHAKWGQLNPVNTLRVHFLFIGPKSNRAFPGRLSWIVFNSSCSTWLEEDQIEDFFSTALVVLTLLMPGGRGGICPQTFFFENSYWQNRLTELFLFFVNL